MMQRLRSRFLILSFLAFTFFSFNLSAQDTASAKADTASGGGEAGSAAVSADKGAKLFKEHDCNTCHKIDQELVGPALAGITERRETDWLVKWIRNSQKMIKEGDKTAQKLWEEYKPNVMPPAQVNEQEVKSILAYIEREAQKSKQANGPGTGKTGPDNIYSEGSIMNDGTFKNLVLIASILFLVLLMVSFNLLTQVLKLNNKLPNVNWNKINAYLLALFLVAGAIGIIYEMQIHTKYLLPQAASIHGESIDQLFMITLIITAVVFVITQILLFFFSFKYRHKEGQKGLYYPVNDKLEIFWTTIPAIALAILIILGFVTWQNINSAPKDDAQVIEVYGYQFNWKFRYPGEDGKLGEHHFTRTDIAKNPLGLNPEDPNAKDDIITGDLHLPVDKQVVFKIRSRDVIHSVYLPHFRVQMYAQPGMNNTFKFTPTITTKAMRDTVNNKDFNYELACNQICGAAHYNMKANVIVEHPDTMQQWLSEQQTFGDKLKQVAEK